MTTSAFDLDLPWLQTAGVERDEALARLSAARNEHWLARTEVGFA